VSTTTTKTAPETADDLAQLRERLERREERARVHSDVRVKRIRRRAELAGEEARTRAEVAQSGEARALRVAGTRSMAVGVLLPVMVAFGAWSAAGVQAGMVAMLGLDPASPAAAAAWLVEPALLGIVAGTILIRARLQSAGGDLDERATYIETAALVTSIVLNMAGHWPTSWDGAALAAMAGHALGPLGAAASAYLIGVVQDSVAKANPWVLEDGSRAPSLRDRTPAETASRKSPEEASETPPPALVWLRVPDGAVRLPIVVHPAAAPTPQRPVGEPPRTADDQREHATSEVAVRPRPNKGHKVPAAARKSAPPKSARALSDAELVEQLATAIADAGLSREPSVAAVQKALGIGFDRAKRVMALHSRNHPGAGLAVVADTEETAA
jgi:hypothetical protein